MRLPHGEEDKSMHICDVCGYYTQTEQDTFICGNCKNIQKVLDI